MCTLSKKCLKISLFYFVNNMITTKFKEMDAGYWVQVGEEGRLFKFNSYGERCLSAAEEWLVEEANFQHPVRSLNVCVNSSARLHALVESVADDFPLTGVDNKFVIDENRQCLGVLFGSLVVTESNYGFNVEIVTNWMTKHRETVCCGLSLDATAQLLRCSSGSRSYQDLNPRPLHLSDANRETLKTICGANDE